MAPIPPMTLGSMSSHTQITMVWYFSLTPPPGKRKRGPGYWKLNTAIISKQVLQKEIESFWHTGKAAELILKTSIFGWNHDETSGTKTVLTKSSRLKSP